MNYLIIGASAAGISAARTLRKQDKTADITVVSEETFPLYSRCLLTYLIAGSIGEDKLYFRHKDFYEKNNIKALLGKKAVSVDVEGRVVSLNDGTTLNYDKLLLATGAHAKSVDVPGADKKGVFTVRNIEDARQIIAMLDNVKEVAVLGGGLIGLRDAYALSLKGKKVAVVVKSPQVLSQMVDKQAAEIIADVLENNNIKIMTHVAAKEILGSENVEGIVLDNGENLKCQMVIIGKGVNANIELAASCGLKVTNGIVVDEFLKTSDENIFSAGDCAQTYDVSRGELRINALWPCAVEQGEVAALNMSGKKTAYEGSLSMNSVDFFGLACVSMGITKPKDETAYEIIAHVKKNDYKKIVLKDNRVVGAVFLGDIKSAGIFCALIRNRVDVSSVKSGLLDDTFDYAKIMPLVAQFGDKFKREEYRDTVISY
ncbi:MAG: FAD-dependent oxidoreductase [Candidatus Omnitrophota bacterium]